MRRPMIAGNWKMNKTPAETVALLNELKKIQVRTRAEVVVCPMTVSLFAAGPQLKGTDIKLGAQNVHFEDKGAFTGEANVASLKELGVEYVILGHSERRQYFGETDETVNARLKAGIEGGLKVILCVGELLSEREQGITSEVVAKQTKVALLGVSEEELKNVIIAYEPVWAIGTGKTATSEQADEVCGIIRKVVASLYGIDAAEAMTIQYGGSMNAGNAQELLARENVDGGLIGGASLKAKDFAVIVEASNQ
ncbi:MAG: triose-phosphate isomerase [Clostridium sp.]|nr:triose-phosphate isomerase [Clostridium sp.]